MCWNDHLALASPWFFSLRENKTIQKGPRACSSQKMRNHYIQKSRRKARPCWISYKKIVNCSVQFHLWWVSPLVGRSRVQGIIIFVQLTFCKKLIIYSQNFWIQSVMVGQDKNMVKLKFILISCLLHCLIIYPLMIHKLSHKTLVPYLYNPFIFYIFQLLLSQLIQKWQLLFLEYI